MDGLKLREILQTSLPAEKIIGLAYDLGVVERESVIDIYELIVAFVLTSRTPAGGRQADVLRAYIEAGNEEPSRGTFYERFTPELEKLIESLLSTTLAAAQSDPVLLPASISGVNDWIIIDSETVKLNKALLPEYKGTGNYAALKVHKAFSVGRHNMLDFELSSAREHDSIRLRIDEKLNGYGILIDLGYASHDRLRACIKHDVRVVIRLKSNWTAELQSISIGEVKNLFKGADFYSALEIGEIKFENGFIDADVVLGGDKNPYAMRLVALQTPDRDVCVFLTNLSRDRYPPHIIGDLYRLRWEIEKSNKLDKSDFCLDRLDCRKPCSARTMIYSSLLGACIVNRFVHADHCERATAKEPPKKGPIHPRILGMALAAMHTSLAIIMQEKISLSNSQIDIENKSKSDTSAHRKNKNKITTSEPTDMDSNISTKWDVLARKLTHLSRDPNWRNRPSVFDKLYGFTAPPGRARSKKKSASESMQNLSQP